MIGCGFRTAYIGTVLYTTLHSRTLKASPHACLAWPYPNPRLSVLSSHAIKTQDSIGPHELFETRSKQMLLSNPTQRFFGRNQIRNRVLFLLLFDPPP